MLFDFAYWRHSPDAVQQKLLDFVLEHLDTISWSGRKHPITIRRLVDTFRLINFRYLGGYFLSQAPKPGDRNLVGGGTAVLTDVGGLLKKVKSKKGHDSDKPTEHELLLSRKLAGCFQKYAKHTEFKHNSTADFNVIFALFDQCLEVEKIHSFSL